MKFANLVAAIGRAWRVTFLQIADALQATVVGIAIIEDH
jgi:hypothetical protein